VVTAANAQTAASNRAKRDSLLAQSDWMVIKSQETNTTLDSDWAAYRQALRNITAHENWPNLESASMTGDSAGDWPVKPD